MFESVIEQAQNRELRAPVRRADKPRCLLLVLYRINPATVLNWFYGRSDAFRPFRSVPAWCTPMSKGVPESDTEGSFAT